ncbi:MAG: ABC-2 transporter permease [Acutalibacteraceae bacterium]
MMTLLYKEMRLVAHPTSIVFAFLGCLVLIPAYPYSVVFMFGCLAPYITFVNARETNDAWYTAILPATKRESVLGKCLLIVSMQLFQLLFSIPFALLRHALHIENNPVGLDATLAWYGFGLIVYAVFDLVFFPAFYKNGYKAGRAFIFASIPMVLLMFTVEVVAHIPELSWLDSYQPQHMLMQMPVLAVGILCYTVFLFLAYRMSVKRFNRVDL